MKILFKNKDFIAICKPASVPTQSDKSGDEDALSLTRDELESRREPSDLWLVHRLDRVVGGVVVFARNKQAAAEISVLVGTEGAEKEYIAVVEGAANGGILTDYIYKDSAKGKAFVADSSRRSAKKAILEYVPIESVETEKGIRTLVKVKLHTGRFHQIRVQFASRKMPIVGDGKYGSHDNRAKMPALFACRLAFNTKNEKIDVTQMPDTDKYPWSLFQWS